MVTPLRISVMVWVRVTLWIVWYMDADVSDIRQAAGTGSCLTLRVQALSLFHDYIHLGSVWCITLCVHFLTYCPDDYNIVTALWHPIWCTTCPVCSKL